MKKTVGVIGTGSFGTVLTGLLLGNGNRVLVYDRDEAVLKSLVERGENPRYLPGYRMEGRPEPASGLEQICAECDIMFSVLPAKVVRPVMTELGNHCRTSQIIVSCTKGLEYDTLRRMTQIIKEVTPLRKVGALSGPNLAKEIAAGSPSSALIASQLDEVIEEVHGVLNSNYFRIFGSHDPAGAEFCGSLKNIYAIASGAAKGLGYGLNARAFLLTKALREMQYFSVKYEAHEETFSGIAGVGDLIATAMSELSRNFRFGMLVAEGKSAEEALAIIDQTVEGYHTAQALHHFALKKGLRLPITETVYRVIYEGLSMSDAVERLLKISVLFEDDLYE
jgi:glycerol-3-phosphate dehydrogenase (NAD(P)+)